MKIFLRFCQFLLSEMVFRVLHWLATESLFRSVPLIFLERYVYSFVIFFCDKRSK